MAPQIKGVPTVWFAQPFVQAQIKEKHEGSESLAFVRGIHLWPVNSAPKGSVKRKMFPLDDAIMNNSTTRNDPQPPQTYRFRAPRGKDANEISSAPKVCLDMVIIGCEYPQCGISHMMTSSNGHISA